MANKEETLGNSFIEAIATIAQDAVSKAGYDKTVKAQITSTTAADKGQYTCKYGAVNFTAIGSENTYKVNDIVMVSIPENNWDNPKVILNKLYTEDIDFKSLDPFDDFLDVNDGKPLIVDLEEVGVKANVRSYTERSFTNIDGYNFKDIYSEPYTRLGIEVALKTDKLGSLYNVNAGTYGIRIKLFKDSRVYFETSDTTRQDNEVYYTREKIDGEYVYILYEGYYPLIDQLEYPTPTDFWNEMQSSNVYIIVDDEYVFVPKNSIIQWEQGIDYYYWTTELQPEVTYYQCYFDFTTPFIEYEFNSSQMFGNLYNFGDYTVQKLLININPEDMALVKDVQVSLFQGNDFTCYNIQTGQTQVLSYPGMSDERIEPNIFAKDLKLYFGYGKEEYSEGNIILTSSDVAQYYKKWEDEKNTKQFSWIYWYKDSAGNLRRSIEDEGTSFPSAYLEYCVNSKDWISTRISSEYPYGPLPNSHGGGFVSYLIDSELFDYETIQFRVRIQKENFNSDSSTRYSDLYSNIITLYKFEPTISTVEYDADTAIQFKYEFRDKIVSNSEAGVAGEEVVYEKLRYNNMENQLYNQQEFLIPHCIHLDWSPSTAEFQKPEYLAGATITWKVPSFEYTESTLAKTKYQQASERFNFEMTTVFMRPRAGYEYGTENETVHFETIDNIPYIVWDIHLSDDFVYDTKQRNQMFYYGDSDQSDWLTMQALTLTFRPKEYYLPTMVNNTIYCTIKKGDLVFESSFEVPIDRVSFSETTNKAFILTEDFEKPYLISEQLHAYDHNYYNDQYDPAYIQEKIFHFCVYQKDYDDTILQNGQINLLRPIGGAGASYIGFDEASAGFQGFLNEPDTELGEMYTDSSLIDTATLILPSSPFNGKKYNFILRKEESDQTKYYLYYFDVLSDYSAEQTEYIDAHEIDNWVLDSDETYYMKVRPFGSPIPGTATYSVGDRYIYEGVVYKCNDSQSTTSDWDPSKWDEIVGDVISQTEEEFSWVSLGNPDSIEYDSKKLEYQRYYIKPSCEFTLVGETKAIFRLYGLYCMSSEEQSYINKYTLGLDDNKTDYIQQNIMSILEDYVIDSQDETYLKHGYWYYDDNHNYVASSYTSEDLIQWYTLRCPAMNCDNFKFLMLHTEAKGIASIKEIPIFYHKIDWGYDSETENYIITDEKLILIDGINKIYCDSSGIVNEKNMGPSEIPQTTIKIKYHFDPVSTEECYGYYWSSSSPILVSYESTQINVLAPSIKTKESSEDHYSPLQAGYIIPKFTGVTYYLQHEGVYYPNGMATTVEEVNTMFWPQSGTPIKSVELPYTVTDEDSLYIWDYGSRGFLYLRYDNIGFTTNYKEVGEGDEYPAESIYCREGGGLTAVLKAYLPIVFQQRQLFRDDFNQWSGTDVKIGDDSIYSPVIGAGRKKNNKFSGCLMGDVSTVDLTTSGSTNYYGLYGYHDNVQSFGLRADGTMFIGKNGKGQLVFDGNKSTIQSNSYATSPTNEKIGMLLDFDDGLIDIRNFKNNTSYFVKLDVTDNNLSLTDKPLKIGTEDNPKFSVDWTGQVYAKDISIDAGTLSGTIEAAQGSTTVIKNVTMQNPVIKQSSSGGDALKFDSHGNLLLGAGLVLGDGGEIKGLAGGYHIKPETYGFSTDGHFVFNSVNIMNSIFINNTRAYWKSITIDGQTFSVLADTA